MPLEGVKGCDVCLCAWICDGVGLPPGSYERMRLSVAYQLCDCCLRCSHRLELRTLRLIYLYLFLTTNHIHRFLPQRCCLIVLLTQRRFESCFDNFLSWETKKSQNRHSFSSELNRRFPCGPITTFASFEHQIFGVRPAFTESITNMPRRCPPTFFPPITPPRLPTNPLSPWGSPVPS